MAQSYQPKNQGQKKKKDLTDLQRFIDTIENEAPYQEFLSGVRADASKGYYPFVLARYMKFQGFKSTYDMINRNEKMIQADLSQYILTDKTVSRGTMQTYVAVVKHFYIQNDILAINWKKLKSKLGEIEKKHQDQAYTPEQIKDILDNGCDPRSKAVVLLLASSGMRIGALAGLLLKHLLYHEAEGVFRFTVYAGTKDEYITFCSREAAKVILEYLRYRHRSGEAIFENKDKDGHEDKSLTKIKALQSPLFREQFDPDDQLKINHPKQLNDGRLKRVVYDALVRSGVRKIQRMVAGTKFGTIRHDVHASHGFRKFCNTKLATSQISPIMVEALLGHKVGLQKSYLRPTEKDLLTSYLMAEPSLTIDQSKQENIQLKQELKKSAPNDVVADLYVRLQSLEDKLAHVEQVKETHQKIKGMTNKPNKQFQQFLDGRLSRELDLALKDPTPQEIKAAEADLALAKGLSSDQFHEAWKRKHGSMIDNL